MNYRKRKQPEWAEYDDDSLLALRFCDLKLRIEDTPVADRVDQLYWELEYRNISFRPHCWFAEEFFSADGVPGIAIPFYLAHPRLMRLERKLMLEVEGGTKEECMRILRHEAGHALDTAYGLHRRRSWQKIFGKSSIPYTDFYQPKPYSRSFVLHLDCWYAQSHPLEDFAETFAVWLKPRSRWRSQYEGWPAIKKLEYVDRLMKEIRDEKPRCSRRDRVDSLPKNRRTLGEYYDEKRRRYGMDRPKIYDNDLRRLFSDQPDHRRHRSAAAFLRRNRRHLRRTIATWTGQYQYTIDQVLDDMIDRCRELDLRLRRAETQTRRDALVMLTVQTMNYLHAGHHRVVR